jgi:hypothetical protein
MFRSSSSVPPERRRVTPCSMAMVRVEALPCTSAICLLAMTKWEGSVAEYLLTYLGSIFRSIYALD